MIKYFCIYCSRILLSKLQVRLNGNAYIYLMNILSKKSITFKFKDLSYSVIEDNNEHHIIKPRGVHFIKGPRERTLDLVKSYGVDKLEFQIDDLILDVGANTGDLIPFFTEQRYIGFEPAPTEFAALEKNAKRNCKVFNVAVGDTEKYIEFFISSAGADSSVYEPVHVESKILVKQIRLDKMINEKVKLLKVDAEGGEVEVITGAKNLLSKIEFIAIDLGFEQGIEQKTTAPAVINILLINHFVLVSVARNNRYLFQNSIT